MPAAPPRGIRQRTTDPTPTRYSVYPFGDGEEIRATWKRLMRENHPDSLASRGVPAEFIASANDKVGAHQRRLGSHQARTRLVSLPIGSFPVPTMMTGQQERRSTR